MSDKPDTKLVQKRRLAAALRQNLAQRKSQERQRAIREAVDSAAQIQPEATVRVVQNDN